MGGRILMSQPPNLQGRCLDHCKYAPPPCITGSVFTSRANFKGIEVLYLLCIIPYTASQQQKMRAGGTSDVKELLTISLVHHPKEFTSELFSNATFVYYSSYDFTYSPLITF